MRRAWAYSRPNKDLAPWFNFYTLISSLITFVGLALIELPGIGPLIAILWLLTLVTSPWLICMSLASGTWDYGLPSFKKDISTKDSNQLKRYRYPQINPAVFKKEEAEARARKYHKQKGQFQENLAKKTKGLTAEETWEKWIKDVNKEKKQVMTRNPSRNSNN